MRSEDVTPPERRQLTGEQLATELIAAAERWKRLREPNPPLRAAAALDATPCQRLPFECGE